MKLKNEKTVSKKFALSVAIEKDKDGYFAFYSTLQDCYTQEAAYEDVIRLHIEDRLGKEEIISVIL